MAQAIAREIKAFSAVMVSGAATSNAWNMGGYALAGIFVPVLTSGYLGFAVAPTGSPALGAATATDGPYSTVCDKSGNIVSALTPGGTGGVALGSDALTQIAGFGAGMYLSGNVAQTANRVFWIHLKG